MNRLITTSTVFLVLCTSAAAQDPGQPVPSAERDRALVQSAFDGELDKVRGLVKKGASVDAAGPKNRTALLWAAANGHTDVVEFLHGQGADINAKDSNDQTALMFAAKGSHAESLQYLLENGADVNARSKKQGFTALIIAAAVGDVEVVRLLLEHGADTSVAERDGNTALDRARQYENPDVVALLEERSDSATES